MEPWMECIFKCIFLNFQLWNVDCLSLLANLLAITCECKMMNLLHGLLATAASLLAIIYLWINSSQCYHPLSKLTFCANVVLMYLCFNAYLYFLQKISCGSQFFHKLKTEKLKKLINIFGSFSLHLKVAMLYGIMIAKTT